MTVLLFSCNQKEITHLPDNSANLKLIVVVDSLPLTKNTLQKEEMDVPMNAIEFIGKQSDTVTLPQNEVVNYIGYVNFPRSTDTSRKKPSIQVYVNTSHELSVNLDRFSAPLPTKIIKHKSRNLKSNATSESDITNRSKNLVQAIPVFITNLAIDTVFLAHQDGCIFMIQEAKDENGLWKPIEYWRYNKCLESYGVVALLPSNLLLVKIIRYTGSFETSLRVKLRNGEHVYYSNTFKGTINKKQFDLPTDFSDKLYLDRMFLNK